MKAPHTWLTGLGIAVLLGVSSQAATAENKQPKPASAATQAANAAVQRQLPFNDKSDFEDAQRGLIARPEILTIKDSAGKVVWDLESYKQYIGLDKPAPDTVNPSLWRNAQLNMVNGLFKVTDRIYQVRGFDLSNITFIQGDTGWIVFDPLISAETAKAALDLVNEKLGKRPVVAVLYSHSHIDHYGGVRGLVDEADVKAGNVKIIASTGFTEHSISENVIAGNAMARRAVYMYGALLPRNAQGGVSGGLGMTTSTGRATLIEPTVLVDHTGQVLTVDGIKMVMQYTPGTEAPTEFNIHFPQFKAMWMAENTTNTMHNILTLRGAQVRDSAKWASFIDESIRLYGADTEVKFQAHHWPMWGGQKIVDYWKKQRDMYKYMHDQSVRLMNEGYTGEEISEMIKLPPELDNFWANRGYYGSLRHNSRAIYQRYMGWYDGNPSDLNNLPPEDAAKKYIAYMGGEEAVLQRAQADFDRGEYRWVAEALKHVVFANPNSARGKDMLADAYEQLGYQAESGPWRSIYLQGAYELRNGVPKAGGTVAASPDTIRAMQPEMLFDYLSVRLNGPKAAGKMINLDMDFTDLGKQYGLTVENGVLNYANGHTPKADASIVLTKAALDDVMLGKATFDQQIKDGKIKINGDKQKFAEFLGLMDTFNFWFNIVTP
ncbi:alkyl/aryl-sulfatase [Pseudoxanthomonas indica]|uniref:Linear primary-alkylsulfatase n=1 Tax=Pseudoxanthomonas indica TaxID=428993 RepID=A0A1T5IV63_9GAMM|nr:alkyl sulfatase dimerization domain-containing protein [Pseudoxanthomonas indica]GGD54592.1 alkyl sulfatase [Pseudoxanthomonas indica]SKC43087.1 Alkyl sulfatase BDS1, metallo-beta-lactamase superfamily [Pseudoxanthomonas indica]